jgi:hypothetical protein
VLSNFGQAIGQNSRAIRHFQLGKRTIMVRPLTAASSSLGPFALMLEALRRNA